MNPPKVTDEDYINFIIATPRDVTATEAERVQPESRNAPAHDAFTRLLQRLEPDPEMLWEEAKTQIDLRSGILVLDDSTLEKPYSEFNALVYRHWSGKQKEVVSGINLITLLWTDGVRCVPIDYRIFDKDTDGKTKNDHFAEMLLEAFERGFNPQLECARQLVWVGREFETVSRFGLAFLDAPESQSADQNQRRQFASRGRSRTDRRRWHALLAQRFRRS